MFRLLKNTGLLLITLAILLGSTGMAVLSKKCGKGHHTAYSVHHEYFSRGSNCCTPGKGLTVNTCNNQAEEPAGISRTKCCDLDRVQYHLPLYNHSFAQKITSLNLYPCIHLVADAFQFEFPGQAEKLLSSPPVHPPPILFAGKALVLFLKQIRIPS